MATINKVTKLYVTTGQPMSEEDIQAHIDVQNEDGWSLVAVDNVVGWYRFFWEKTEL